jgi:hypothetical protein
LTAFRHPGQNAAMAQIHSIPAIIRRLPLCKWLRMRASGPEMD